MIIDLILADQNRLASNLKLTFRGNSDGVLDIVCSQFRYEDQHLEIPRLLPSLETLKEEDFPLFVKWWYQIRINCNTNVSKHRPIALLIPALEQTFGLSSPSGDQWTLINKFLGATRATARDLQVEFPESKGRWRTQREQFDAFYNVVQEISNQ